MPDGKTEAMKRQFWEADIPDHPAQAWEQGFQRGYDVGLKAAREQLMKGKVKMYVNSDMDIVVKFDDLQKAAKAAGYNPCVVNLIVVPKEENV
jgi:hypothetical protein